MGIFQVFVPNRAVHYNCFTIPKMRKLITFSLIRILQIYPEFKIKYGLEDIRQCISKKNSFNRNQTIPLKFRKLWVPLLTLWKTLENLVYYSTNTPRGLHVQTTCKRPFPRRLNVESAWCVCRVIYLVSENGTGIEFYTHCFWAYSKIT